MSGTLRLLFTNRHTILGVSNFGANEISPSFFLCIAVDDYAAVVDVRLINSSAAAGHESIGCCINLEGTDSGAATVVVVVRADECLDVVAGGRYGRCRVGWCPWT